MPKRKHDHRPLLLRVVARLCAPGILVEEFIAPDKGDRGSVLGLWERDGTRERITINPVPGVVQTVIHECLHSLHPDWSERYVQNRETYLYRRLTNAEVIQIYNLYQERVQRGS